MKRIYLVVNPDRITWHPPTFIHPTYDSAEIEATRLARENPGQEFHVVSSVVAKVKRDVDSFSFGQLDEGVPF
jgi:hypothetical protein